MRRITTAIITIIALLTLTTPPAAAADLDPSIDWHHISRQLDWLFELIDGNNEAPLTAKEARVQRCESGGNPLAVSPTGKYRGHWQFDQQTWDSVADPHRQGVDPIDAPAGIQRRYMRRLHARRGWQPWPECGLR
jgi:hypothetical protein